MMQVIDQDYIRAITELPDGIERLHRWISSLIDERDMAQAIAASCVRDVAPLRRRVDRLLVANTREVELRRELQMLLASRGPEPNG